MKALRSQKNIVHVKVKAINFVGPFPNSDPCVGLVPVKTAEFRPAVRYSAEQEAAADLQFKSPAEKSCVVLNGNDIPQTFYVHKNKQSCPCAPLWVCPSLIGCMSLQFCIRTCVSLVGARVCWGMLAQGLLERFRLLCDGGHLSQQYWIYNKCHCACMFTFRVCVHLLLICLCFFFFFFGLCTFVWEYVACVHICVIKPWSEWNIGIVES